MYTLQDIYYFYRREQAFANNRGFRMPKDFDFYLKKRLTPKNRESLELVTKYFNTKWRSIDPSVYFRKGFEIYKNFGYHQFFNRCVIERYIEDDRDRKRAIKMESKKMLESSIFVKGFMKENQITSLGVYAKSKDNGVSLPVRHYMINKIDPFFLVWLIKEGMFVPDDVDMPYMNYILTEQRNIIDKLNQHLQLTQKIKEVLSNVVW